MTMPSSTVSRVLFPLMVLALGGVMAQAAGCTVDDEPAISCADLGGTVEGGECKKPVPTGAGGQAGGGQGGEGGEGGAPAPNSLLGTCYAPQGCQVISENKCLAKVDNTATTRKTLRMSQLRVRKPTKLANKLVQFTIVSPAVTQYDEGCLLRDAAKGGLFNWLLDFDTEAKKLRTGGARSVENINEGYCFLNASFSGLSVEPIEADMNLDAETGAFSTTTPIPRLTVPIFQTRAPDDVPILLPLLNAVIYDGVLSPDGNCIGRYRGDQGELTDGDCDTTSSQATSDESYRFVDGAFIEGAISLEEADQVKIIDISNSLCVLLSGVGVKDASGYSTCKRDENGNLAPEVLKIADTASKEGGPIDSVKLVASFAASAIKVVDGVCE